MENIAKMNNFCSFSEGSLRRVLQKLPSCAEELRTAKQGNELKFTLERISLKKLHEGIRGRGVR